MQASHDLGRKWRRKSVAPGTEPEKKAVNGQGGGGNKEHNAIYGFFFLCLAAILRTLPYKKTRQASCEKNYRKREKERMFSFTQLLCWSWYDKFE